MYDPDVLTGYGKRDSNWDFSTEIQHELRPGFGVTGGYYWNNGELTDYQDRLFSREAVARNGVLDYDGVTHILEEDKHTDAKSAGKHSWALTQFGLWYEIYITQNPAFAS